MEPGNNRPETALLVMDVQSTTVQGLQNGTQLLSSITNAIATARANKIPVIYAVIGFRKDYPEVNRNNKSFSTIKKNGTFSLEDEEVSHVHHTVAPKPDDVVVVKKRVSAFTGSDLEVVLRSFGIRHIVLSGISTSGVVLSTLREAADKDYVMSVLSDCCADRDEEVHRVLITKVFPKQAEVLTSAEWQPSSV